MRYLVTARLKDGKAVDLQTAMDEGTLGAGSVAGDEYFRNMNTARTCPGGRVQWVETCFCPTPLLEEREYWEPYFELERIQDAHARSKCRDFTGEEPWACCGCDCTVRLEQRLTSKGEPFRDQLKLIADRSR